MARTAPLSPTDTDARPITAPSSSPVERSRLGAYAAFGGGLATVPLPWVPDSLVRRVRGALVHDIAVRHGLSLTRDAREVLAEPSGPDGPRSLLAQAARFVGGRFAARTLAGPFGMLFPLHRALQTYTLGHLFDRYLELSRVDRAVRIDVEEARHVRQAVDGALGRALTIVAAPADEPTVIDDQRDALTTLVDGLFGFAAGMPARLVGRLDAAFDDLLHHARD